MLVSVSTGYGDDPKYHCRFKEVSIVKAGELGQVMTQNFWSPIIWHGGYRRSDNFISADLLALDFDNGIWTIDRATEVFKQAGYFHIIGTTKSHTAAHHRFRAVLVWHQKITDGRQYRQNVEKICDRYPADPACKDTARMFRKCTQIVKIEAGKGIVAIPYEAPPLRVVRYDKGEIPDFIHRMLSEVPGPGNRNKHCFRIAAKLAELGHSEQTCIDYVLRSIVDLPNQEKISAAKSGFRFASRGNI